MFRSPFLTILAQILILVMTPQFMSAQTRQDSTVIDYDSIQDERTYQLERMLDGRLDQIEREQLINVESLDSMGLILEDLLNQLEHLERDRLQQSEELSMLQDQMEHSRESSQEYRKGLQRILWIVGSVLLILLVASFLVLLLLSLKTRSQMDRLRWKQKRFVSELKKLKKELRKELQKSLKSLNLKKR